MDTSFVERLKKRAGTMLPAATVMMVECAADSGGGPAMVALLEEIQQKGLKNEPLCTELYDVLVFDDRVLLRCRGCSRQDELPKVGGIGRGQTEEEAEHNAYYALTLPMDKAPIRHRRGCMAIQVYGEGPVEVMKTACIFNRVAYKDVTA